MGAVESSEKLEGEGEGWLKSGDKLCFPDTYFGSSTVSVESRFGDRFFFVKIIFKINGK